MTDHRKGALALILGNAALLLTMLLHPTGHDLASAGSRFDAVALLNTFVHTLAILALPALFLGALALTRALAAPDRYAITALVFYGVALAAGLSAAVLSGYVAPDVLRNIANESGEAWRALFRFTGILNQSFARVLVVGSALAIALWSLAMREETGLRWYGIVSSLLLILAAASGILPLHVHGFGLVVLLQGIWFVLAARMLLRRA